MLLVCVTAMPNVYAAEQQEVAEAVGDNIGVQESALEEESWDTGDAISDILDNERYAGAVSSIAWLTERVDILFTMAISFTAFAIISAAILKNVLAGAYAAFPKFFDKVAEAHDTVKAWNFEGAKGFFKGGFKSTQMGAVSKSFLALVPNVKALTDFDDGIVEPKHYFMKAIPQMIAAIIIGIFIYNGYYRDTAMLVGSVGAETFERVFWSVDPAAVLDRLTMTTGMPSFSTDNAIDKKGVLINNVAKQTYRAILTKYSDVAEAPAKARLAAAIEDWAIKAVESNCHEYVQETEAGKIYNSSVSSVKLALVNNTGMQATSSAGGDKVGLTLKTDLPVKQMFGFDSTKESGLDYYAYVYVTFVRDADAQPSNMNVSYTAGQAPTFSQTVNNGNKFIQQAESKICKLVNDGTALYAEAPDGYEFYCTGSYQQNTPIDGIQLVPPKDAGFYTRVQVTGEPTTNAEYISFESRYGHIILVSKTTNDAGQRLAYRVRISTAISQQ